MHQKGTLSGPARRCLLDLTAMRLCMRKVKEAEPGDLRTGRKTKNDIIFIAVLLLLVSVAALVMFLFRTRGDRVIVTVDGQFWGEYSLNEDRTVEIRNGDGNGDGYNLLIIEGGTAYVKQASCPDGICSSHRPIQYDGECIICLPNKVVVEIRALRKDQPDIIS